MSSAAWDWQAGDEIITCNLEHSSVLYTSLAAAQRHDLKVRVVDLNPQDSPGDHPGQVRGGLYRPYPAWSSSATSSIPPACACPPPELTRLAHDRGAFIMLDGAQTGGHLRLDMAAEGFDFYSIPGQKWVLGYEGRGRAVHSPATLIERVHPAHSGGHAIVQPRGLRQCSD